jgi:hypothetical protein
MQVQSDTTACRLDEAIQRMLVNSWKQDEFEAVQQSVPCSVREDEEPGMRPGVTGPFELPSLGIAKKIYLDQLALSRVSQH